jgi:hypothetical protein
MRNILKIAVKLRPSGHSDDFTVVAEFREPKEARRQKNLLKKDAVEGKVHGSKFITGLWCSYRQDAEAVASTLTKHGASSAQIYSSYQELTVSFSLPKGAGDKVIPLILTNDEVAIYRRLIKICGKPKAKHCKNGERRVFKYEGERIFFNVVNGDLSTTPTFNFGGRDLYAGKNVRLTEKWF